MNAPRTSFVQWSRQGGRYALAVALIGLAGAFALGYWGSQLKHAAPQVVFVRTNEVMARYKGAIDARTAFQKDTAAWAEEARQLDQQIQEKAKGSNLNDPKLRTQLTQMRSRIEALKEKGSQRDHELMTPVLAEVNAGIKKFAQKHGYKIVLGTLDGGVVLHGGEDVDVTDALIADLNS